MPTPQQKREEMIVSQILSRGIHNQQVVQAIREVPREEFVPTELKEFAFEDTPLSIGEGQTISQPFIVALMIQEADIRPGAKVLEVGTGSGYAAAVLSRIAKQVFTIERIESLARSAQKRFIKLGYHNVFVRVGDGTLGWTQHAPYDAIIVAAGGPHVPQSLLDQLTVGGNLIIPITTESQQQRLLKVHRNINQSLSTEDLGQVRFVPLIGEEGWKSTGG